MKELIVRVYLHNKREESTTEGESASLGFFNPYTKEALSFTNAKYSLVNFQTANNMTSQTRKTQISTTVMLL